MTTTDRRWTEADVTRYATNITGHPDATPDARHLAATRAVLGGLAADGRLSDPQELERLRAELEHAKADRQDMWDTRDKRNHRWMEAAERYQTERDEARARVAELEQADLLIAHLVTTAHQWHAAYEAETSPTALADSPAYRQARVALSDAVYRLINAGRLPEHQCGPLSATPPETAHDPTHGRIDPDIQGQVDAMQPDSLGQRVAIENTPQERRTRRTPPETAPCQCRAFPMHPTSTCPNHQTSAPPEPTGGEQDG